MKRSDTGTNRVEPPLANVLGKGVSNEQVNADQYNGSSCPDTAFECRLADAALQATGRITRCLTGTVTSFARCGGHRRLSKRALSDADDVDVRVCDRSRLHQLQTDLRQSGYRYVLAR